VIYLVQPPLIQLNSPYPAPYYLKSFLDARGYETVVSDHSIALFSEIFCPAGLKRVFADAQTAWENRAVPGAGNPHIRYNIERFLSEERLWLSCIERLTGFLRGRDDEWGCHLALANGAVPGGPRFDACLDSMDGEPPPDAAPLLASKLLADLADFITVTLDPSFALIRYAESLTAQKTTEPENTDSFGGDAPDGVIGAGPVPGGFARIPLKADGYIMRTFYRPFLERKWAELAAAGGVENGDYPFVILITIPFPGCLAGALICAESAKQRFGGRGITVAGGGYVNTELRFLEDRAFFDYFDFLSFDRGYGSLAAILDFSGLKGRGNAGPRHREPPCYGLPRPGGAEPLPLYKTLYRAGGRIIRGTDINTTCAGGITGPGGAGSSPDNAGFKAIEKEAVQTVFPDYSGVDYSLYLRITDDPNPMHRLWSGGRWLKAYLAHGCYWHNCAFCDVTLDYIRGYDPVNTETFFRRMLEQSEKTGVRGIHLVDEAAPAASLLRLAELNRPGDLQGKPPLNFWGNIRFEKAFTPDAAALLAAGGLTAVSGGIEVATAEGFRRIGKGISLPDVVRSCAAFKEAGILTHAYLIYGYWDEEDQEIIDSAEILRQLFAAGLLDSAFWHKFVLTCHSRIFAEWRGGLHRTLKIPGGLPERIAGVGNGDSALGRPPLFACNDLTFEGDNRSTRFTEGLDRLLAAWMAGNAANPVQRAFPFSAPPPAVSPDTVTKLLDEYAREQDQNRRMIPEPGTAAGRGKLLFLGSKPLISREGREGTALFWRWRLADHRLRITPSDNNGRDGSAETLLRETAALLEAASRESARPADFYGKLKGLFGKDAGRIWRVLREGGLVWY
jgi:hypothetical protein